jgi:hypothetical protein
MDLGWAILQINASASSTGRSAKSTQEMHSRPVDPQGPVSENHSRCVERSNRLPQRYFIGFCKSRVVDRSGTLGSHVG